MSSGRPAGRRPVRGAAVAVLLIALALAGCATARAEPPSGAAPSTPAATSATTPNATPTADTAGRKASRSAKDQDEGPQPLPSSPAVRVTSLAVPAIGLRTRHLETLALLGDGSLAAPKDPDRAGWYADGTVPGDVGPALIAGHVDSVTGPAVFARLGELREGETVRVGLSDGSNSTFRIDEVVHTRKNAFPSERVYGPTPDAQLRLVTCSGPYDRGGRGYLDNTVIFATAVTAHP